MTLCDTDHVVIYNGCCKDIVFWKISKKFEKITAEDVNITASDTVRMMPAVGLLDFVSKVSHPLHKHKTVFSADNVRKLKEFVKK